MYFPHSLPLNSFDLPDPRDSFSTKHIMYIFWLKKKKIHYAQYRVVFVAAKSQTICPDSRITESAAFSNIYPRGQEGPATLSTVWVIMFFSAREGEK